MREGVADRKKERKKERMDRLNQENDRWMRVCVDAWMPGRKYGRMFTWIDHRIIIINTDA